MSKHSLDELYIFAKEHKDNHKSCGGEPYKSYNKLAEIINSKENTSSGPLKILEIGTAVGFTTYILQGAISPRGARGWVDTIEYHPEHIEEAKKNISAWGGDIFKINFFAGDAEDILKNLPRSTGVGIYDLIFFDGYGAKLIFYNDFKRLLKVGGLLITANQHLKSTEKEYFQELENTKTWEFIEEFADTKVYRKIT